MSAAAKYLPFKSSESAKLREQFLKQAHKVAQLFTACKPKDIRITVNQCELDGVYLVIVRGVHDGVLVKLGRKFGMPRGFPVLWVPAMGIVRYFGFLPKFSNDERQTYDEKDFQSVADMRFFKKWSGFLGQLLVFEHQNIRYYTVCSKNSVDCESKYIQDAKRLFDPYLTAQLVGEMIAQQIHICAEIMSQDDQTHGARVLRESPVVTVIGRTIPENGKPDIAGNADPAAVDGKFVQFLTHAEVVSFCVHHGLPCDSAVTLTGPDVCLSFLQRLSQLRDFLADQSLDKLVADTVDAHIQRGTVKHCDILGQRLEGLVFFITYLDGSTKTKKYKFPGYTIRTMLFRPLLADGFQFGLYLRKKAEHFVNFWCVSPEGKRYWLNKALEGFMAIQSGFCSQDAKVGLHIQLFDHLDTTPELTDAVSTATNALHSITPFFEDFCARNAKGTVIVIVGPIGYGKSTMMNDICQARAECVPIDGDILGLPSSETVMNLKMERNPYTVWKVLEALMRGRVPVISTGGGALLSPKCDRLVLRDCISRALGIHVKLIVMFPRPSFEGDIEPFAPPSVKSFTPRNVESFTPGVNSFTPPSVAPDAAVDAAGVVTLSPPPPSDDGDAGVDGGQDAGLDDGQDAGLDDGQDAGLNDGQDAGLNDGQDGGPDGNGHFDGATAKYFQTLYADEDRVKETVRFRLGHNIWTLPSSHPTVEKFASFIAGKSKQNQRFAQLLAANADCCYTFPITSPCTKDPFAPPLDGGKRPNLQFGILPISPPQVELPPPALAKFTQLRVLTEVVLSTNDEQHQKQPSQRITIGHITLRYDASGGIHTTLDETKAILGATNASSPGRKYDLQSQAKSHAQAKKSISLVVPDVPLHPDGRTHVTISSGVHEAKDMALVAMAIFEGKSSIQLGNQVYTIDAARYTPCVLKYLDVFGISD